MAVTTKDKKPAQKYMELFHFKRLMVGVNGPMYEQGVAYPVTDEQLESFLAYELEGIRPFRQYVEKPKVAKMVEGISVPVAKLPTSNSPPALQAGAAPRAIEIGSESELDGVLGTDGEVEV